MPGSGVERCLKSSSSQCEQIRDRHIGLCDLHFGQILVFFNGIKRIFLMKRD